MNGEISKGDIVKPVHCKRSQYMNKDFTEWVNKNSNSTFVVESKVNNICRLRKVGFSVTDEFLERVK